MGNMLYYDLLVESSNVGFDSLLHSRLKPQETKVEQVQFQQGSMVEVRKDVTLAYMVEECPEKSCVLSLTLGTPRASRLGALSNLEKRREIWRKRAESLRSE